MQLHASLKTDEQSSYYDSAEEQKRLMLILAAMWLAMLRTIHGLVLAHFGLDPEEFRLEDAATRRIVHQIAARAAAIDQTTRQGVASTLREGHARGYTNWQLAHGVADAGFTGIEGLFKQTWSSRAESVARTELQVAQAKAAVDRYVASGMVDRVQIIDGCQWDTPCCERNGTVVPIEQAPTLNHPNCTLVLVPVLRHGATQPPATVAAVQAPLL